MTQRKLTLITLSLAALLAWSPDALAQRGSSRPSAGSSSGVRSSPSRSTGSVGRSSIPSRSAPSRSAPSRSSGSSISSGSSGRSLPSSSSSGSSRSSSGSSRVISIPSGSSSGGSRSSSGSSYGSSRILIPSTGSSRSSSIPIGSASTGTSTGTPGLERPSGPSSSRGYTTTPSRGFDPSASSAPGSSSSGGDMIYANPRRVPFPAPATPSADRGGSSRGSAWSSSGGSGSVPGLRSDAGPSAARFGLDRGSRAEDRGASGGLDRSAGLGAAGPGSRVTGSSPRTGTFDRGPAGERPAGERGEQAGRGSEGPSDARRALSERLERSSNPSPEGIGERYARGERSSRGDAAPGNGREERDGRGETGSTRGGLDRSGSARGELDRGGRSTGAPDGGDLAGRDRSRGDLSGRGETRRVPPENSGRSHLGRPSPIEEGEIGGLEHTDSLRRLAQRDPKRADEVGRIARRVSDTTRSSLNVGIGVSLGLVGHGWGIGAGYWDDGYWSFWGGYYGGCYADYGYWWGLGCYPYSYWTHPFSYPYYCYYGYWPSVRYWYPSYYYPLYYSYPVYTASVITRYVYDDYDDGGGDTYVIVNEDQGEGYDAGQPTLQTYDAPAGEAVAGGTGQVPAPAEAGQTAAQATGQYLTLGDQAFRDGRFADAVHFYARAVQFAPEDGVLWLVLSDGLFATGDYHYGAFALRKALALQPGLAESPVEKQSFYSDPSQFDRQLAVLEGFVRDHPSDTDARLMLAANYLFGGRPAAAVDLIEAPGSETLRADPAAPVVLEAARAIQYGR